ncbi:MAG: hypothetical protein ACYC4L_16675 [Chloroflexota bacterium]
MTREDARFDRQNEPGRGAQDEDFSEGLFPPTRRERPANEETTNPGLDREQIDRDRDYREHPGFDPFIEDEVGSRDEDVHETENWEGPDLK